METTFTIMQWIGIFLAITVFGGVLAKWPSYRYRRYIADCIKRGTPQVYEGDVFWETPDGDVAILRKGYFAYHGIKGFELVGNIPTDPIGMYFRYRLKRLVAGEFGTYPDDVRLALYRRHGINTAQPLENT